MANSYCGVSVSRQGDPQILFLSPDLLGAGLGGLQSIQWAGQNGRLESLDLLCMRTCSWLRGGG